MATTTPPARPRRELTWRAVLLGALLTFVFTAANAYFGLRVGLTFSTAIPSAIISMALLRAFSDSTIVENNITQTIGSAAGAMATMIFVLPGLVMIGWWRDFPYWTTMAVCFVGGTLGVMMSVPLRRALVTGSSLTFPEGVAGAEVLKVGARGGEGAEQNRFGLVTIVFGAGLGALMALLGATRLAAGEIARSVRLGDTATGFGATLSLGLMAVGHLIGLSAGLAMALGMAIAWGALVPWQVSLTGIDGPLEDVVGTVFGTRVRFIGAGAIAVAAVWTLLKLIGPIAEGLRGIVAAQRARAGGAVLELTERDLPGWLVGGTVALSLLPIGYLLWRFAQGGPVAENFAAALVVMLIFVVVIGAIVAAVTGYMAGLVGTSNSPVSGVGILSVLVAAVLIGALFPDATSPAEAQALTAFALFATAFVFGVALISNDNLQDLKTGQLVGSTPWKQQAALVIGVLCGSLVIPPVLDLLNHAFGFAGAPGAGPNALAAPQASLISSLGLGVLGGTLEWWLLAIGGGIAAAVIAFDELVLARGGGLRLPPLGVAMGIYLPMALILPTVLGAVLGHLWDKRAAGTRDPEFVARTGVLLATGLIVGDSLFGLGYAGVVGAFGAEAVALVGEDFAPVGEWIGVAAFFGLLTFAYTRTWRAALRRG